MIAPVNLSPKSVQPPARLTTCAPLLTLLTGGGDRPYALGIARALLAEGLTFEFLGSADLESDELLHTPQVTFLSLRGVDAPKDPFFKRVKGVLLYYIRLLRYVITARPMVFHILWNNRFPLFDRTLLMLLYRALGKRVVFTAHNVNAGERDAKDSAINRLTLKIQYRLCSHIFVHTESMKRQLATQFGVRQNRISTIPLGINDTVPNTALTCDEARQRLGLKKSHKVILFYGRIAPYKGIEHLIEALARLVPAEPNYRLLVVGRLKNCADYWRDIQERIRHHDIRRAVVERIEFVPDSETEIFFKSADVLALPYTHIFQSGVLVLGYNFGLPAIAADVGSFREDVLEGETGLIFKPQDPIALANAIRHYFSSELYANLPERRPAIQAYARQRYSWSEVGRITRQVYSELS
jgi:D-inositol-3-phosphate glycosyltransferase